MKLSTQRTIAAKLLKVGKGRVWIDPNREDDVSLAITREDIRNLIHEKVITAKYEKGVSHVRARKIKEKKENGQKKRYWE